MRLLLLAEGDPETFDSWSGSSRGLLRALRALGHQVIGEDVSEAGWRRWVDIARTWVPNRRRWTARYHLGAEGFRRRSRAARELLAWYDGEVDAVLQIGATFDALTHTGLPGFVYCDSNASLFGRDAPAGEVAALRPAEREAVVSREREVYTAARTVFAMSEYLRQSFLNDFGVRDDAVRTTIQLTDATFEGSAAVHEITGLEPIATNDFGVERVGVTEGSIEVSGSSFEHAFPACSVTVLRLGLAA